MVFNFMNNDDDLSSGRHIVDNSDNDSDIRTVAAASASGSVTDTVLHGSVHGFFDTIIPTYSPDTFRSHFWMSRSSFEVCECDDGQGEISYWHCITKTLTLTLTLNS